MRIGLVAPAAAAWHSRSMRRLDRYDVIGLVLVALVVALWIAHLVVPAGPPPAPV